MHAGHKILMDSSQGIISFMAGRRWIGIEDMTEPFCLNHSKTDILKKLFYVITISSEDEELIDWNCLLN
jgi:hypothetical protein